MWELELWAESSDKEWGLEALLKACGASELQFCDKSFFAAQRSLD